MLEYTERLDNMSKVFRRPMFRKGGGVNMNGIMSGIEDRQNYSLGELAEPKNDIGLPSVEELTQRNIETLQKAGGESTGYDPLTTFLLQYGPALASASPTGNFLSTALGAAKEPLGAMLQDKRREEQYQRELRTQAAGAAIKTVDEMRQAFEDRKFKKDLFNKETDRLKDLQQADFSQEAKMLGLKQDFEGDMFERERDLKLNMQKIDNALKSGLLDKEQQNKLEILQKQYENSLSLLEAEMAGTTSIDSRIDKGAAALVESGEVSTEYEAKNQLTWQLKTSGELMNQGYNVADELLTEQIVLDPKKFSSKAKKLSKKPGNEGRIFYFPKGDEYYVLEGGVFKPFDLPGKEGKTEKNSMDTSGDKGDNVVEEVDGITNYEYGTGDKRNQTTAIRQKIIDLKGPINNPNPLYDTSMTRDQKSAYERYLSDYRNR